MKKVLLLAAFGIVFLSSCGENLFDFEEFPDEIHEGEHGTHEGEEGSLTLYKVQGEDIVFDKDFSVPNKYLDLQADKQLHQDVWEFVTDMIPGQYRDKISQFEVFHGEGELLGYVMPVDENDLSKWKFALGIDQAGDLSKLTLRSDFTYTTIHEYGHVLTLNDEQVVVGNEGDCNEYFTGEGCAKSDAYINKIVEIGWADILDEAANSDPFDIYDKYSDRFVSEYAATNPGEDIAEVFTVFVIEDKEPRGSSIKDKKIQAMYDFPELIQLRSDIRKGIGPARLRELSVESYLKILPRLMHKH